MRRTLTAWFLLAAVCYGSQSPLSVFQIGAPWRPVSVNPSDTNDTAQDLAFLYQQDGTTGAVAVADMVNITNRRVYDVPLAGTSIDSDAAMTAYLEARTLNPELDQYPWSALSVGTYGATYGGNGYNHSVPCTLISATHAIAGDHNVPAVGAKLWFLEPDGDAVIQTVAARTLLTNSNCYLVRLTANPSTDLARLPIATNESLPQYDTGCLWMPYQTLELRLRVVTDVGTTYITHADSIWNNDITQGSGRPALVALTNDTLVITGTLWTVIQNKRVSADIAQIETILSGYGETLTTVELPEPNYDDGTGGSEFVGKSLFRSHIFGVRQR